MNKSSATGTMKTRLLVYCFGMMLTITTQAGVIYSATSGSIPDGSAVGWSATGTASGYDRYITDVSVNLRMSGGYNGDLYAYLSYGSVLVPLLNRVGVTSGDAFGYGDSGFYNITLSSAGANDIHFYQNSTHTINGNGQLSSPSTWQPDGRAIDPQSAPASFDSASRVDFGSYNGMNPNGTWTLFFADLSAGSQSQLESWTLNISASTVPEPVNVALVVFGGAFGLLTLVRSRKVRNLFRRAEAN
jgi:hypothetical protein